MSGYLQVLWKFREELESGLENADLLKLTEELTIRRVVTKDAHDKLTSLTLDTEHLKPEVKVRYLLQLVCDRVRESDGNFKKLEKVLNRLGEDVRKVCEAMGKELDKGVGDKASSGVRAEEERQLVEQDVPGLVECLVHGSYKWEEIGVALGLPEYRRDDCSKGNNEIKLTKILTAWIAVEGARATLNNLRKALASSTVSLKAMSDELGNYQPVSVSKQPTVDPKDNIVSNQSFDTDMPKAKRPRLKPVLEIDCQSLDTEVAEGRSTLLEVQVIWDGSESYQWSKDGQPLVDGADYSGVSSNMLYINRASLSAEGKYCCSVSTGSGNVYSVDSDEIDLAVHEISLQGQSLLELANVLLKADVLSAVMHSQYKSLDCDNISFRTMFGFLQQQVCHRFRASSQVYDKLNRAMKTLEGTMQDMCGIMRKELDRIRRGEANVRPQQHVNVEDTATSMSSHTLSPSSPDIKVDEGKSTLLEVPVGSESYQWSKNGLPLVDGADYSGVSSNMLYINRASLGTEGKYCCCVSGRVSSGEISVKVIYPQEKEALVKCYSLGESEVPKDSWPPVGNTTFINLVLVKQKPMSKCDYYTLRGGVDDIPDSKEAVTYEDAFGEYREGTLMSVEGRPGSGKTTLVHKMTRDWARGRSLKGARVVFLVTLRLASYHGKDETTLDLLKLFYDNTTVREKVQDELEESGGKGACFILDGLDEYEIEKKKDRVIYQLIHEKLFRFAMIIVASRPVATRELRKDCDRRVEVVGFSKDQIYEYVETYPFPTDSESMVSKLKKYLAQHPNVLHMCYLPVYAAIICFLFHVREGDIPHTETKIYEQFVIATLLRHKERSKEQQQIKSLKDLGDKERSEEQQQIKSLQDLGVEERALFRSICKLAFGMTVNSQQVLNKSDAEDVCLNDGSCLGLLTLEQTYREFGRECLFSFHHLTLQEFLAAYYVHEVGLNTLAVKIGHSQLFNVWKFYCGLAKTEECTGLLKKMDTHNNFFVFRMRRLFRSSYKVQCAFESENTEVCNFVIGKGNISFRDGETLTSYDWMTLGYVLSKASQTTCKIFLSDCKFNSDGVMALTSMVRRNDLSCVKSLMINCNYAPNEEIKAWNSLLGQLPFLEKLIFEDTTGGTFLSSSGIQILTSNITLPQLQVLHINQPLVLGSHPEETLKLLSFGSRSISKFVYDFSENCISSLAICSKMLFYTLGPQSSKKSDICWMYLYNSELLSSLPAERLRWCSEVVIVNCGVDDEGAEMLAKTLDTSVLRNLVLDFNSICDLGATALASCLSRCGKVEEVCIQCNCIGNSGAMALVLALVDCSSLRRLDLQGNGVSDEGAIAIAKRTSGLPSLDLYLRNVNITEEGIEKVLECRATTEIRFMVFSLSWDGICEGGIDVLRRAMKCKTLPALRIDEDNIDATELVVRELDHPLNIRELLFDKMSDNTLPTQCRLITLLNATIQYLDLDISICGSAAAAQCLSKSMKTCKSLHSVRLRGYGLFSGLYSPLPFCLLDAMKSCTALQSLDICLFKMDSKQLASLFNDPKSLVNLHTLKLRGFHFGPEGAKVLSEMLVHSKSLRSFQLDFNDIDDSGAIALAEGLKDHIRLQELNIRRNKVTSASVPTLARVLRNNSLHYLNLNECGLSSVDVCVLVDVLNGDSIQTLDIGNNDISCEADNKLDAAGVKSLCLGLVNCTQLKCLNISGRGIGSDGLVRLAQALQNCPNLQELNLHFNDITSDGVPAILNIMKSCKHLQKLDLSDNRIGVDGGVDIVGAWQRESVLILNLDYCFSDPHHEAIRRGKKCCSSCDHLLDLYYSNHYLFILYYRSIISKVIYRQ